MTPSTKAILLRREKGPIGYERVLRDVARLPGRPLSIPQRIDNNPPGSAIEACQAVATWAFESRMHERLVKTTLTSPVEPKAMARVLRRNDALCLGALFATRIVGKSGHDITREVQEAARARLLGQELANLRPGVVSAVSFSREFVALAELTAPWAFREWRTQGARPGTAPVPLVEGEDWSIVARNIVWWLPRLLANDPRVMRELGWRLLEIRDVAALWRKHPGWLLPPEAVKHLPPLGSGLRKYLKEMLQNAFEWGGRDSGPVARSLGGARILRVQYRRISDDIREEMARTSPPLAQFLEAVAGSSALGVTTVGSSAAGGASSESRDLALLEVSIFDSGIGIVPHFSGTSEDDAFSGTMERELGLFSQALEKHRRTEFYDGKGIGNALRALGELRGFAAVRSGRVLAHRDFASEPWDDDDDRRTRPAPESELTLLAQDGGADEWAKEGRGFFHCDRGGEGLAVPPIARGTLQTFFVPVVISKTTAIEGARNSDG